MPVAAGATLLAQGRATGADLIVANAPKLVAKDGIVADQTAAPDAAFPSAQSPLSSAALTPINVRVDDVVYRGRHAVRIVRGASLDGTTATRHSLAVLTSSDFTEGVVEVSVAGLPRAGADTSLRGFVGIAFHVAPDARQFRAFYLRPTNGRATDQLRRNHSIQYIAEPEYPWQRLRREQPGVYESYVDLEPGVWTNLRIVVARGSAQLYIHDAEQPSLIVNDLKPGVVSRRFALWIGLGTEAYFTDLRVAPLP